MHRQCDEEKPQCRNCRIHNAACVYGAVASRGAPHQPALLGPAGLSGQGELPSFTLGQMELLHHYTSSTALTLSSNAQVRNMWQDRVPRLALHADYVLDAFLAVSALHLAHLRPRARLSYWTMGVQLYQTALGKAKLAMEHISEENCTELFLFSTLTCFFSFAKNGDVAARSARGDDVDNEEIDLLHWVFLFRGTRALLKPPYETAIKSGALRTIIERGEDRVRMLQAYSAAYAASVADELRETVRNHVPDAAECEVYGDAVQLLQRSFHAVYSRQLERIDTTDVFIWLFHVSDEYMDRLKTCEPPALAIFTCFSVLVQQLKGIWWAQDWGEWIARCLRDRLRDQERSLADKLLEQLTLLDDRESQTVALSLAT
ncbi:hypothetical protein DL768_008164 [Monosporascus sp. mg162]|nr:hypothetical protein DL768_008164 [Monosporascus sp. mg162]